MRQSRSFLESKLVNASWIASLPLCLLTSRTVSQRKQSGLSWNTLKRRFRLSYILGSLNTPTARNEDEELFDDDNEEAIVEGAEVTQEEHEQFAAKLRYLLQKVDKLAASSKVTFVKAAHDFNIDLTRATPQDRDTLQDLVEEDLQAKDDFHMLVDEVLDGGRVPGLTSSQRAAWCRAGIVWPTLWTSASNDREEFIRSVNRFSSNYAPNFGRLLTPLEEGIRVRGPFVPDWHHGRDPTHRAYGRSRNRPYCGLHVKHFHCDHEAVQNRRCNRSCGQRRAQPCRQAQSRSYEPFSPAATSPN